MSFTTQEISESGLTDCQLHGSGNYEFVQLSSGDQRNQSGHTFRRVGRTARWIPAFYANDAQLRAVLAQAVVGHCFSSGRIPSSLGEDLKSLTVIALQKQADVEAGHKAWNGTAQHFAAVKEAGSYLAFIAGISYRAWRLRWHSPDIARESGMTTLSVNKLLEHLVMYAERLGFPTYKPKFVGSREPKAGRKKYLCPHVLPDGRKVPQRCKECRQEYRREYKRYRKTHPLKVKGPKHANKRYWPPDRVAQLMQLRESGKTFREIAEVMGLKRSQHARFMWTAHRKEGDANVAGTKV